MSQIQLSRKDTGFLRLLASGKTLHQALQEGGISETQYHALRIMLSASNETQLVAQAIRRGIIR